MGSPSSITKAGDGARDFGDYSMRQFRVAILVDEFHARVVPNADGNSIAAGPSGCAAES